MSAGGRARVGSGRPVYSVLPDTGFDIPGWEIIGGTITTDGSLGELTAANIVDWSISFQSSGNLFLATPVTTEVILSADAPGGLVATATGLLVTPTFNEPTGFSEVLIFDDLLVPNLGDFSVSWTAALGPGHASAFIIDNNTSPGFSMSAVPEPNTPLMFAAIPEPAGFGLTAVICGLAAIRRTRPGAR